MNNFIKDNFIGFNISDKCGILFSKDCIDFKIDSSNFKINMKKLKEALKVDDIGFLKQIHSDIIMDYNGEVVEGDSIITSNKNIALGVFTADCVPIMLCDEQKGVIAAVHSGWKGTEKNILGKTIDKMIKEYHCKKDDIAAFIGPHIQKCCYEVSEDLIDKFKNIETYKKDLINEGRYLDLNACILSTLKEKGVLIKNIYNTKTCTYCEKEHSLHSYRRDKELAGRIFSVIYFNK